MSGDDLTIITPRRKIIWEPEADEPPAPPPPQPDIIATLNNVQAVAESKRTYKKRSGNGHKSEKTRDLFDYERDIIRDDLFLPKNGQISNDDCVTFRNARINDIAGNSAFNTIAIFQITGYVSVLHTQVAEGRLMVNDLCAYEQWMSTKYGRLWARYNHRLYVAARAANAQAIAAGRAPTTRANALRAERSEQAIADEQGIANSVGAMFSGSGPVNLAPAFVSFGKKHFASQ